MNQNIAHSLEPAKTTARVCPHGHSGAGEGKFCLQCGSMMVEASLQQTPMGITMPANQGQRFETLAPLAANYSVDPRIFQWSMDAEAMTRLRSITPLVAIAKKVSDRVGRRWVESTCNGIRLSKDQLPEIYELAVHAARCLSMRHMPVVYLSGERPWETMTFGSEEQSFIVIGSALAASFRSSEMLFILAREMGRIVAGHTLWRTVIRFLVGELNPRAGMLRGGLTGLLDPTKWLEGAIELPLLGWARQAEITADRAGLLAVGNEEIARRTLMAWSLKAPNIPPRINLQAWIQQQEEDAFDQGMQLSEMFSSATPYIARRLKLLSTYAQEPQYLAHRQQWSELLAVAQPAKSQSARSTASASNRSLQPSEVFTTKCPHCQTRLQVPKSLMQQDSIALRCSNQECRKVHVLRRNVGPKAQEKSAPSLNHKPSVLAAACD